MPDAARPTRSSGTSGQGRQDAALPGAAGSPEARPGAGSPDPFGANVGTVQPATAAMIVARRATIRRGRRGTMRTFRRIDCGQGYPVGLTVAVSGWSTPPPG